MGDDVVVNGTLTIPEAELSFSFSRSGGPGGQNVNKVSTRVELQFDVKHSPSLRESQRQRLLQRLERRLDSGGVLHLQVDDSRSQWQNRQIAVERFSELLADALRVRKRRIPTRRTAGSNSRRLEEKKKRGGLKKGRRGEE